MTPNIIVLLPGIGGSRLERDGKAIYDLTLRNLSSLIWNWVGADLAYTGGSGKPDDGVVATDLFNNQLIPGFFGVDDYDGLCATLRSTVKNPAQQFLKFPYDWRASNRWAAEALDAFIRPKLHDWQKGDGGADAKLWLVCHSMGGLVARYFLEHLGGAAITRRLITLGTPHRGSPKALGALVNGIGLGPLDFSTVIRSFPSVYELLPQYPVVRVGDGDGAPLARIADFFGLGSVLPLPIASGPQSAPPAGLGALPNIDPARLTNALEFHAAIRRPVLARMTARQPAPYQISCVFNRRQPTPQSARWSGDELRMSDESPRPVSEGENPVFHRGDGTVPGPSAIPIEWADTSSAIAVNEKHVAMPSAAIVTDIVQNFANPLDAKEFMSGDAPDGTIGLAVPALVWTKEPFAITVDVVNGAIITVSLTHMQTGAVHSELVQIPPRSSKDVEFRLPAQGTYAVTAKSVDPLRPPTNDFLIAITR